MCTMVYADNGMEGKVDIMPHVNRIIENIRGATVHQFEGDSVIGKAISFVLSRLRGVLFLTAGNQIMKIPPVQLKQVLLIISDFQATPQLKADKLTNFMSRYDTTSDKSLSAYMSSLVLLVFGVRNVDNDLLGILTDGNQTAGLIDGIREDYPKMRFSFDAMLAEAVIDTINAFYNSFNQNEKS